MILRKLSHPEIKVVGMGPYHAIPNIAGSPSIPPMVTMANHHSQWVDDALKMCAFQLEGYIARGVKPGHTVDQPADDQSQQMLESTSHQTNQQTMIKATLRIEMGEQRSKVGVS